MSWLLDFLNVCEVTFYLLVTSCIFYVYRQYFMGLLTLMNWGVIVWPEYPSSGMINLSFPWSYFLWSSFYRAHQKLSFFYTWPVGMCYFFWLLPASPLAPNLRFPFSLMWKPFCIRHVGVSFIKAFIFSVLTVIVIYSAGLWVPPVSWEQLGRTVVNKHSWCPPQIMGPVGRG